MSDIGDSQAGPHGEPIRHLERAQTTLPAVGIQDKQARNTKLQRVNLQGASCSTQQSSEGFLASNLQKLCGPGQRTVSLIDSLLPVSYMQLTAMATRACAEG